MNALAQATVNATVNPEIREQLTRALGDAVVRLWGHLPHETQNRLFREAAKSHDLTLRPRLAILLHEGHPRTAAARRARAVLEPDSLGG